MSSLNNVWHALSIVALIVFAGCTPDHVLTTAPVTGTASCNGNLLTEGYIIFTPVVEASVDPQKSGKSGYATIQPDGTYTVSTYEEGDGALIGKHQVRIHRPDPEDDEQITAQNKFACGNRVIEVTVTEGENVIDLDPARQ